MALTPLLDINEIGVAGDFNQVAAPTNTWLSYLGDFNELNAGSNSAIVGSGDLNTINMAGPGSLLAFQGSGNQVQSGGGNAILGQGDFNMVTSHGLDLIDVQGLNLIDQRELQSALAPYLSEMSPDTGLPPEVLLALLSGQGEVA